MRLTLLVPGTGSYFCGSCLRDDALTAALRARGHEVRVVPLYLPLVHEVQRPRDEGIRMGGINLYLEQKLPLSKHFPGWLKRWLDHPALLRLASRQSTMTEPSDLGELTLATLRGRQGSLARLFEQLVEDLAREPAPDAFLLSNVMLASLAAPLRERFRRPVVCTLQGELPFLEALPRSDHDAALELLGRTTRDVDAFHAVSRFHADWCARELALDRRRVHVVYNGIELADFAGEPRPLPAVPTLGYLARLCPDKGFHTLVGAFIELARRGHDSLRLVATGVFLPIDRPWLAALERRLQEAGLAGRYELHPNVPRARKLALLASFSLFSVPATYGESFGLYVLEALASGVPVVQPRHGAFTELIEALGGGLLVEPDDERALADGLEQLLADPARAESLARAGRSQVFERFSAERMGREVESLLARLIEEQRGGASAVAI